MIDERKKKHENKREEEKWNMYKNYGIKMKVLNELIKSLLIECSRQNQMNRDTSRRGST